MAESYGAALNQAEEQQAKVFHQRQVEAWQMQRQAAEAAASAQAQQQQQTHAQLRLAHGLTYPFTLPPAVQPDPRIMGSPSMGGLPAGEPAGEITPGHVWHGVMALLDHKDPHAEIERLKQVNRTMADTLDKLRQETLVKHTQTQALADALDQMHGKILSTERLEQQALTVNQAIDDGLFSEAMLTLLETTITERRRKNTRDEGLLRAIRR